MYLISNKTKYRRTRIILLIALSLLMFFLFDRGTYILFKYISKPFYNQPYGNSVNEKINENAKLFYDTLILGSSRTKQGIHPWYLKEYLRLHAYKNARAGQYLRYNYYYYKIFKEKYKVPDIVIYGFDYFIFTMKSTRSKMRILSGIKQRTKIIFKEESSFFLFDIISHPSLLLQNKEKINTFMIDVLDRLSEENKNKGQKHLISGFRGQKRSVPSHIIKEPVTWVKKPYYKYPGSEGKYLDLLFNELQRDNVKVFLVILPDYINVYKTNFERDLFFRETESIFKKYKNVTILNYYSPDKFDIQDSFLFRDGAFGTTSSHMSFKGAEIFNKILCEDIKKVLDSK